MIRMPSSTMIVGPSGSGKTQLTEALLTEGTVFEGRKTRPCHYCYAVWQPRFDGMKRQGIQFHEGERIPGLRRDVARWSSKPFQIDGETSSNSLSRARNVLTGIS